MNLVEVAAAAMRDRQGRVLLTKRPAHVHQGGLWEFPGGKLEAGESPAQALVREIREELGATATAYHSLLRLAHDYGDKRVRLYLYEVTAWQGEPHGREGQPLEWVPLHALDAYPMPAANRPFIHAARLPPEYLITGDDPREPEGFLQRLDASLAAGVRLVQLRAPAIDAPRLATLARDVRACCAAHGAALLINAAPEFAMACNADGVHLNGHRLRQHTQRPIPINKWLGVSCHTPADLAQAIRIEADFAVLSPLLPTASHPNAQPLGWERFAEWIADLPMPVYALGGMGTEQLPQARDHGAQGIAAIRGLWRAP